MPRKAATDAPAKPVEQRPEEAIPNTVTNTRRGFTLHLGDGRKLAFGETAEVGEELAALIGDA